MGNKQRESHVKSLRLLQLEKAIQNMNYPSVAFTHEGYFVLR